MASAHRAVPRTVEVQLARSAAPRRVETLLDRLLELRPELAERFEGDETLARSVVAVAAASRHLGDLLVTDPAAIDVLTAERRALLPSGDREDLLIWKRLELLRVAALDLTGRIELPQVGALLARLATEVLRRSCELVGAEGLAVIGMGKLGGEELNYSSDVDVMLVAEANADAHQRAAREVVALAGTCFRIDTNLRPEGRDGALVRTLDSYESYWSRWAAPWEFQALLKARPVAGDHRLGRRFHDTAQRWLWTHPITADDLRSIRNLKARGEREVRRRGLDDRDLKRAPGGIRDIEFSVQLLQLVHGRADTTLRRPGTLAALGELDAAGYVDHGDAEELLDTYVWLRTLEHRLQLDNDEQVHHLPSSSEALDRVARVCGYRDGARGDAAELLVGDLRSRRATVRTIHERLYFRPLLEAFVGGADDGLSPDAAEARLAAFGFSDATRTRVAVRELTRGLNRTSRLMQQLLPLVLDWLSRAPDPDLGLLMLRNLLSTPERATVLTEVFRDSPAAARRLCGVLGTSRLLGDILLHDPDLVERLPDVRRLQTASAGSLRRSAGRAIEWREDTEARNEGLRRWKDRHLLGIAVRDLGDEEPPDTTGRDLTALADATLDAALASIAPGVPFAIVALGRYGGASMSFGSDLDVLYVFEGDGPAEAAEANRAAVEVARLVSGVTPAQRIFLIDPELRPEGRHGPLARSSAGYLRYWSAYAQPWERMAMTRARAAAGDVGIATRLLAELDRTVWDAPLTASDQREIRRMKVRTEQERIPGGQDASFHLKLGRGSLADVEFTVQLLQLAHRVREPNTMVALDRLVDAGHVTAEDAVALMDSYRFCERVRNRTSLVGTRPEDALPTNPDQLRRLARSLDLDAATLRETYRRLTRRARHVTERLFYGIS